jgi:hypothetical protein
MALELKPVVLTVTDTRHAPMRRRARDQFTDKSRSE